MIVYRLSREKYKNTLSGIGAAIQGGRWNRKGTEVIYTASSRALAMVEVLVHLPIEKIPDDYFMLTIYLPDSVAIHTIPTEDLPDGWNVFPYNQITQSVADHIFHSKKYGVVKVPSAAVRGDFNYLIDPNSSGFDHVKIVDKEKFPFDRRLVF